MRATRAPRGAEAELLVLCARPGGVAPGRIAAALDRCDDDERLLALARRHGMLPLLLRRTGAASRALGRAPRPEGLHAESAAAGALALRLTAELLSILDVLAADGIRALPFKGPVLSQRAYGTVAMRQSRDLDILVADADLARAAELLEGRGYDAVAPLLPLVPYRFEYQLRLDHAQRGTRVELHWRTAPPNMAGALALDDVWEAREHVRMLGHAVPSLGIEELILVLCVHGAKHRWERLEWIACLARLLATSPPSWERLLARGRERRCARMLRVGMLVAGELLGAPLPAPVVAAARRDAEAVALAADAIDALFATDGAESAASDRGEFQLRLHERMNDKLRYLWLRRLVAAGRFGARVATTLRAEPQP